jgi:cytochrome c peroxidase
MMHTQTTCVGFAGLVIVLGLAQIGALDQHVRLEEQLADEETQLQAVLLEIEAEATGRARAGRPWSWTVTRRVIRGAVNFFRPFPGGNGRSCATCHNPRDGFSLSPATVEARWRRLQRARRQNPEATDPLFRPIDADDGQDDFTLLRTRALVKVRVPLPSRVRLTADPTATHVTLSRAVTPLNMLKHTAPYQQDRSAATLEAQALGAVNQHMEPTVQPTKDFLETVAEFQRQIFSSVKVRKLSAAINAGRPLPDVDPPLTAFEQKGKEKFDDFCRRCHGGPAQVKNLENRVAPPFDGSTNPESLNIVVSNPPPNGFPASVIQGSGFDLPTQLFTVDLPTGTKVVLESSDPGTVLTDVRALETGGRQSGLQSLRCPAAPRHQPDRPLLSRSSREDARGRRRALSVVLLLPQRRSRFPAAINRGRGHRTDRRLHEEGALMAARISETAVDQNLIRPTRDSRAARSPGPVHIRTENRMP